ncbi:unnamed protein product [Cochlearia groenlandica]
MRSLVPIMTIVFLLFTTMSHASKPRLILVGGYFGAWKIPDSSNNTLNHWAENNRFKIGDFLVWKYEKNVDSVLQVTKEDYEYCNTSNPLKQYNDGDTKVELEKSGPYFFISGAPSNCEKGEKITLVVLAERKPSGGGGDDNPKISPISSPTLAPAQAPTAVHNAAVGLKVGSGLCGFLTAVVIGLVMV